MYTPAVSLLVFMFFTFPEVQIQHSTLRISDSPLVARAAYVTTTLSVSICGNAIVDGVEVCDDGLFNDGGYGSTTATKRCNANCSAYGPFCGDAVLQPLYDEACDDGNATNGDLCSNMCVEETATGTPPATTGLPDGGSGGAGGAFTGLIPIRAQTRVTILGKAYPGSMVNILKDGQVAGVAQSNSIGDFTFDTTNVLPGPATFGFWSTDAKGLRSITFTTTFQVTQNAVTTVSNVYLPPTIDLKSKKVKFNDILDVFGTSAPDARVFLFVDKETDPVLVATTSSSGGWVGAFPVDKLSNEAFHAVKGFFELALPGIQTKSGYSQSVNFYVGTRDVAEPGSADLNNDGRVNLVDFSILLFHWGTDHAVADLNVDGKVNLTDFSILLFNWTG
ncbi:MAG: hypothetical protein UY81_C0006G0012 [Candidatus Giovannonibacteria bacterium GW2011_GWA2_53_7]|uniref:Dockerin domain-containing protein n=1 Tax=Candidatus Giovannonibacteria bacterium GW2011_GWA2_53_7 TaxID=1618650 RepID=A0A0G1Y0R0_9BACT|nr:MAG: hypothetical protein UY81_C0006G0012 [Candidatus Giovannonibacteria bacterium GW2011_GWA2_53_7]